MVSFTPNIGLAKPVAADLAKDWAVTQEYADDNNVAFQAASAFSVTPYTPVWAALTTNPTNPNGNAYGEYWEHRGFIMGSFTFLLGAGVTAGVGGTYGISLPALADSTFHNVGTSLAATIGAQSVIGEGYLRDDNSVPLSMITVLDIVEVAGVAYARMFLDTYTGKTARSFAIGQPFTVAVDDKFSGSFFYKKAP